jgi:hypothetical protein
MYWIYGYLIKSHTTHTTLTTLPQTQKKQTMKENKGYSRQEIKACLKKLLLLSNDEITEIEKRDDTSELEKIICRVILKSAA